MKPHHTGLSPRPDRTRLTIRPLDFICLVKKSPCTIPPKWPKKVTPPSYNKLEHFDETISSRQSTFPLAMEIISRVPLYFFLGSIPCNRHMIFDTTTLACPIQIFTSCRISGQSTISPTANIFGWYWTCNVGSTLTNPRSESGEGVRKDKYLVFGRPPRAGTCA